MRSRQSIPSTILLLAFVSLISISASALASEISVGSAPMTSSQNLPKSLENVSFVPRLGSKLSLSPIFKDPSGSSASLGKWLENRPVLFTFAYFNCPNLCNLVLDGILPTLTHLKSELGKDFKLVTLSIDPKDTPIKAHAKAVSYGARYRAQTSRPIKNGDWLFLTGKEEAIRKVAQSAGFAYQQDPGSKEYSHASGWLVLDTRGKITAFFPGIHVDPRGLDLALNHASKNAPPLALKNASEALALFCFHYDPSTGRYSLDVLKAIRVAGLISLLFLGLFLVRLFRKEQRA